MKTHFVIFVAFCSISLAGCKPKSIVYQIDGAVQRELTNDVVGYSRTIKIDTEKFDGGPKQWQAIATVEFVNATGGISRTNLPYAFGVADDGKLYAHLDGAQLAIQLRQEFDERLKASRGN